MRIVKLTRKIDNNIIYVNMDRVWSIGLDETNSTSIKTNSNNMLDKILVNETPAQIMKLPISICRDDEFITVNKMNDNSYIHINPNLIFYVCKHGDYTAISYNIEHYILVTNSINDVLGAAHKKHI